MEIWGFTEKHGNLRFYWEAWKFEVLDTEKHGNLRFYCLGRVLEASWGLLGASLERHGGARGCFFDSQLLWSRLGTVLEASWRRLAALWGRPGGVLEALGSVLGASWRRLGGFEAVFEGILHRLLISKWVWIVLEVNIHWFLKWKRCQVGRMFWCEYTLSMMLQKVKKIVKTGIFSCFLYVGCSLRIIRSNQRKHQKLSWDKRCRHDDF